MPTEQILRIIISMTLLFRQKNRYGGTKHSNEQMRDKTTAKIKLMRLREAMTKMKKALSSYLAFNKK